ncbi:MAG: hypothetical protein IKD22_05810, partial [Lentisphaeria bacterium]|nr:hypothetical protein [Lentisphaeria bacterium]
LTPALEAEGMARELVSKIQNLRKESQFEVTDRINVICDANDQLKAQLEQFMEYICGEVLAADFVFGTAENQIDVNGISVGIAISKAE